MSDVLVRLEGVSKRFRRGAAHDTLADVLGAGVRKILGRPQVGRGEDAFCALEDVSFEVSRGEALGIIGANGAGKSTALKLIARILRPDAGRICTRGRLTALIEISAGFHGDLTGRENIYMNASILGMRKPEIDRKLDAIIDFTGIEEFIDTPVKRYSSGMSARLGFSVAAHVDPDILLVDEVLSVGDVLFRQRCLNRMGELIDNGTALLFVTHHIEQMQSICGRTVVLDHGRLMFDGDTDPAVAKYIALLKGRDGGSHDFDHNHPGQVTGLSLRRPDGTDAQTIRPDEPLEVEASFRLRSPVARAVVEIDIQRELGAVLASFSSVRDEFTFAAEAGDGCVTLSLPSLPLGGGQYFCRVVFQDLDTSKVVADSGYRFPILVDDDGRSTGALTLPHAWSYEEKGRRDRREEIKGSISIGAA